MKKAQGLNRRQHPKIVCDMKIKSISSGSFQNNILCFFSKLLHGKNKLDGQLGVVRPEEYPHSKVLAIQQCERFYLDVLVVH